jgi:hypothetical protein
MSQPVSQLRKTKHPVINHQQQEQRHHHHPEQSIVNDPLLDRKIEDVASGLVPYCSNILRNFQPFLTILKTSYLQRNNSR